MNAVFVANKPSGISSNHFLGRLKRKYGVKKAGFSGTLDPFASGTLIVAFGSYTKLFRFLKKEPKIYVATMWLGASSQSGDNQNISNVQKIIPFAKESLEIVRNSLLGKISYVPPKFSAKHVDGVRAYELARKGVEFELKNEEMEVFASEILHYRHPFLTFKISLSEGGYVRSYAKLFAKKLGFDATLTALHRQSEGDFKFENEKFLDAVKILNLPRIEYFGEICDILDGKMLATNRLSSQEDGVYLLEYDEFFSIIQIAEGAVKYCLNKVEKC